MEVFVTVVVYVENFDIYQHTSQDIFELCDLCYYTPEQKDSIFHFQGNRFQGKTKAARPEYNPKIKN